MSFISEIFGNNNENCNDQKEIDQKETDEKNIKEEYNPDENVCDSQDDFNHAIRSALKYNMSENKKYMEGWGAIYIVLYFVFIFWAVFLALKVSKKNNRTLHIMFAIIFAPGYIIAHYIGKMKR